MKIAYLLHWNLCQESGVIKKILAQVNFWSSTGHQARMFAASPRCELWTDIRNISHDIVWSNRFRTHIFKTRELIRRIIEWQPDLVYLRFSYYYPGMGKLCEYFPLVAEINTDDVAEYSTSRDKHLYFYHLLTRNLILREANGFVCLTNEIANRYKNYRGEKVVIGNSINLNQYNPLPPSTNIHPSLIFLGTADQPWHGVDKIHWLAEQRPNWQFHIIGMDPPGSSKIPSNLVYHGFMRRAEYDSLFEHADIAIGTLALHRKHMDEACPIKLREYLAYGLPSIIGYRDIDFPNPTPFLLQIPNVGENVQLHLRQIDSFVYNWKGRRVPRSDISHIDLVFKEKIRLSFLCDIVR